MLPYEHDLDHTVSVQLVPVLGELGVLQHHCAKLVSRHRGVPQACVLDALLESCLLKEVALVRLVAEVTDTLGADYRFVPFPGDVMVESVDVERVAPVVHEGADSVFLSLSFIVMVVMVPMLLVPVVPMLLVPMFLLVRALDLVYPGCGCSHLVEVEPACVQDAVQVNVAEVALYDFRFRLERLDDAPYPSQLLRASTTVTMQSSLTSGPPVRSESSGREQIVWAMGAGSHIPLASITM